MSTDDTTGSAFGRAARTPAPDPAAVLRQRMASSAEGFLGSAAWVPWKRPGTPEAGNVAHVMIRDKPFVPVFTDPADLTSGMPDSEARPLPMADLVRALPEEFGIVVDPKDAETVNFLHADVLAGMRAAMRGGVAVEDDEA